MTTEIATTSTSKMFVDLTLNAWDAHNKRIDKMIDTLSDDQWAGETATGRNSGIYLLGHLTAVSDSMLSILGLGERLYPELDEIFLKNGDKAGLEKPSFVELKSAWNTVNSALRTAFNKLQPEEWLDKHTSVSAEDFAKEPHRNRMNVLISRINHQAYHMGQLAYLNK